jgi:hypothetical protein
MDHVSQGRPGPKADRHPMFRGTKLPFFIATLPLEAPRDQGASISSDRGPSDANGPEQTSDHQQLGTFISSVALLPDLDGSLDGLASPSHRRPWFLIAMGPLFIQLPRSPRPQSDACGMVPSLATSRGDRSTSLTARPPYQVIASSRVTEVPSAVWDLATWAASVFEVPRCR